MNMNAPLRLAARRIPARAVVVGPAMINGVNRTMTMTVPMRSFSSTTPLAASRSRKSSAHEDDAVEKLRAIMNDYRQANYAPTPPSNSHFKTQVTRAAILASAAEPLPPPPVSLPQSCTLSTDSIAMDGLQRVLMDIGAEQRLSQRELHDIFDQVGRQGEIPVQSFYQIL